MHKIFSVANLVFKKRARSLTYYWMILAPIILFLIGIGIVHYIENQNTDNRPTIAIIANKNVHKAIITQHSKEYKINEEKNPKTIKNYLKIYVIDGILYVNKDFSKATYEYDARTSKSNPINYFI